MSEQLVYVSLSTLLRDNTDVCYDRDTRHAAAGEETNESVVCIKPEL